MSIFEGHAGGLCDEDTQASLDRLLEPDLLLGDQDQMIPSHITEIHVPRAEIDRIIATKLLPAVQDERLTSGILALFTLALSLMKRDITEEELTTGVRGLSEWAVLHLSLNDHLEDGITLKSDKVLVN